MTDVTTGELHRQQQAAWQKIESLERANEHNGQNYAVLNQKIAQTQKSVETVRDLANQNHGALVSTMEDIRGTVHSMEIIMAEIRGTSNFKEFLWPVIIAGSGVAFGVFQWVGAS